MARGRFVVLEGLDGAGKSLQAAALAARLRRRGLAVAATREPGGAPLSEQIRELLLRSPSAHPEAETLLFLAARREHVAKVISPALRAGKWVVCDRFTDSTFAYQGGGRGVAEEWIEQWTRAAEADAPPDVVYLLESPLAAAPARLFLADAFETEGAKFYHRVRAAYLRRAAALPNRALIPRRPPREVTDMMMADLHQRFKIPRAGKVRK